jgi:FixJ family two-component response regulator
LTPGELEVLKLLIAGLTNREIASVLGNGENIVRNQTIRIFAKLYVSDRQKPGPHYSGQWSAPSARSCARRKVARKFK